MRGLRLLLNTHPLGSSFIQETQIQTEICSQIYVYLFISGCYGGGKNVLSAEAEPPSRKVLYLPLLDHYPGLGLLYCVWHLEPNLPAAF